MSILARRCLNMTAVAAIALAAMASEGMAQSAKLSAKAQNLTAIMGDVRANGRSRVIVEFAIADSNLSTKAALSARKASVRATQDAILASAFGSVAASSRADRALSRMKIEPMFAISASLAEIEKLAADSRVVRIHRDDFDRASLIDSVPLIQARQLQVLGGTGEGFIVAIVDTGVERRHDFIKPRVIAGACFSTNSGAIVSTCRGGVTEDEGLPAGEPCSGSSDCTHGTHVAGIAAGKLTNPSAHPTAPKRGVAYKASIFAINVFSRQGTAIGAFVSDQIKALEWVFDHRNDFPGKTVASINMSLGSTATQTGACDSDSRVPIITTLRNQNIATVIASGNSSSVNGVSTPGCISNAITVSSTDKDDTISSFSNMGTQVDVLAPGGVIQSSIVGNSFAFFSGTSMATPHVAGAWAALRSLHPTASVTDIEGALESTGKAIADDRPGSTFTKRRIRVKTAHGAL